MELRLLGSLELENEGRVIRLAPKERGLLALLLLHANDVVSSDALIDGLWGEGSPSTAKHTLETHVSRLRKTLTEAKASAGIVTEPGGYVLRVEPCRVDLSRFQALLVEGREALAEDPELALRKLDAALALWRGPPLMDVALEGSAAGEVDRLEEQQLEAVEARIDALLALGRHAGVVGDLELLVACRPEREGLVGRLMLALYRTGRQTEALDVYHAARERLVAEFGIEPGEELQRLQQAILRHDHELDRPVPDATCDGPVDEPPRPAAPRARRRRLPIVAVVVLLTLAAGAAAAILTVRDDGAPTLRVAGNGLAVIDAGTGRTVRVIQTTGRPGRLAAGDGMVWVVQPDPGTVERLDIERGVVSATVHVGRRPSGIAIGDGAVWVADEADGTVSRIDAELGAVTRVIHVGEHPVDVVTTDESVWVLDSGDGTVRRIDAVTGSLVETVATRADGSLAAASGELWATSRRSGSVLEIDPLRAAAFRTVRVGNLPDAVAADSREVWVASPSDCTVYRIDPSIATVTSVVPVGQWPTAVALDARAVWVANESSGTVTRIERGTQAVRTLRVGGEPQDLVVSGSQLVVSVAASHVAHRFVSAMGHVNRLRPPAA